ncbi:AAA ATPase afg3, partial [Coemansia sp. RSA 1694]
MLSAAIRTAFPQSRSTGLHGGRSVAQAIFGKHTSIFAQAAKPASLRQKGATLGSSSMRAIHSSAKTSELNRKNEGNKDDDVPVGFENFLKKSPKKDGNATTTSSPKPAAEEKPGKDEDGSKSEDLNKGPEPDKKEDGDKSPGSGGEKKGSKKDSKSDSSSSGPSASDVLSWAIYGLVGYEVFSLMQPEKNQVTWQEFQRVYLDRGLVERLVVVNRNRVRAILRKGPADGKGEQSLIFSIGSIESFEKQLLDAQDQLGIPPSQRIPVEYRDEVSVLSTLLHFAPTLLLIGAFVW